jgi:hypothetical protein
MPIILLKVKNSRMLFSQTSGLNSGLKLAGFESKLNYNIYVSGKKSCSGS